MNSQRFKNAGGLSVEALHDALGHRFTALVEAAHLLAAHQRVHQALTSRACLDADFDEAVRSACPDWLDPGCNGEGPEVLQELLRHIADELRSHVRTLAVLTSPPGVAQARGKAAANEGGPA